MNSGDSRDLAQKVREEARQLAAQGMFEEALAKHIWFHDHALEIQPSYYGVRLSYALNDWVEFGKQYPKAIEELKAIRNQKASRLLGGEVDRQLFHDVESINDHLKEVVATVQLFKAIEGSLPEFAASIYDLADTALIAAEEYDLACKYLGDPLARLGKAAMDYAEGLEWANTRAKKSEPARQAVEHIFQEEVVRIITVLAKTGKQQKAREVQSKAIEILDSSVIRDVLY